VTAVVNTWFAEKLRDREIYSLYLKDHHPIHMPCLQLQQSDWNKAAELARQLNMRFSALWAAEGSRRDEQTFYVYMLFAHIDHRHILLRTPLWAENPSLISIGEHYIAAVRMERHIQDLFGIEITELADKRTWVKHSHWPENAFPLRKDFESNTWIEHQKGREYNFLKAEGEGVYELAVGPVHAGIIEPGHFRFLAVGEQLLNMEIQLGYTHKGIEKRLEGMTAEEAIRVASRTSGDMTVAYGWAFSRAAEAAADIIIPERASSFRAILCERERLANHIGDIGSICNDAGFAFMHVHMQRLREEMARLHKTVFGHRLMMDLIVPGGINFDLNSTQCDMLRQQTQQVAVEVDKLRAIYEEHPGIQERVIGSGVVTKEQAESIGMTGYAGRASGVYSDERVEEAYHPYDNLDVQVPLAKQGSVATRVWVRFEEIKEATRLIDTLLQDLPSGAVKTDWITPEIGVSGLASIESWRGEIICWIRFTNDGRIDRCTLHDPSEVNWLGLELAVRNVPIPDFPLNNKSFNCSYSGNDR